ncbi:MAG: YjbE family putative metal transport protein [Alphaproteobacteria bacterium]|nr:YjbE family putative metal transport protein [Alphaproteobacteria bacterium]
MLEWFQANGVALFEVILIDIVLAGDNAIIVGLAASRVAPELRAKVIFWGTVGAVGLRIAFAAVTTQLLAIIGLTLAGGLLLLWVCWKMWRNLRGGEAQPEAAEAAAAPGTPMSFRAAVTQVVLADVTMSLDNVLAVAGAAKGSPLVLVIGLAVAIVLMAFASHSIARLLARYPWISWVGLLIVFYVALDMIWDGSHEVACRTLSGSWCEHDLVDFLMQAIGGIGR